MKSSNFASRGRVWWPLLSLVAAAIPAQATVLVATPTSQSITCSTTAGPGAAVNVVIKPATGASLPITVSVGSVTGLVITAPTVVVLSTGNATAGLTYTVRAANGCAATSASNSLQFSTLAGADITVPVTATVTVGTTSPLTVLPAAVTFICTRTPPSGGGSATYSTVTSQAVGVKSATPSGTPFTVNTTGFAVPSWLTVTPTSGGTATTTAVTLTLGVASGCGGFSAPSSNNATIHLTNGPSPDKTIQVVLKVVPPTTLTAVPAAPSVTYVKGSGSAGRVDVNITASNAPFFTVDTTTLPIWLNVDATTGTAPKSLRFSTTVAADSMPPGTYSGTVHLQVSNQTDLLVPITLQLNNPAPRLTIAEGLTKTINWTVGNALPTPLITAVSSDSPIAYTVATGGPLAPIVAAGNLKDFAYNIGTPIPITFDPTIFASATPGTILTGTVSLTWGSPATITTVTFFVTVAAPGAAISSINPASLPTAAAGQSFTLVLSGTNFVGGTDPNFATKVGVVTQSGFVVDPSISASVVNPSNIILTIVVPSTASVNLPFATSGTGGTVVLGVCNPSGAPCNSPTSTISFAIGGNPIIQAVTSSSSYLQVSAPTVATVAPYGLTTIFGSSFCSSRGTGCASSDVLRGTLDPLTLTYATTVSPDTGTNPRQLSVVFQSHATTPVVIGTAPVLFATNNQINIVAPSALSAYSGSAVDVVVNFGYGTGTNLLTSAPFALTVADSDPGIFTVTGDGQGLGAFVSAATLTPVGVSTEAGMRSVGSDSDTIQIFMTGLGIPNSTALNSAAGGSGAYSADCISMATYLDSLNFNAGTALTTMDGMVVSSALLNTNRRVPCFLSSSSAKPSVTVGGVAATVTYAGWVPDSVAGQYEVDVQLPASGAGGFTTSTGASLSAISVPVQLPVVVTTAGPHTSQAGVMMWVTRKLKVVGPSGSGLTQAVGLAWPGTNNTVTATEGTAPYRYAVTSGVLPAGLSLTTVSNVASITGTPAAGTSGTYLITVTATDSANFPLSDKVSFTLTITGGLFITNTGTAPFHETFGTQNSGATTTITATGGIYPYTYALTSPPTGVTIDSASGAITVSSTVPGGTYHLTATAVDSTGTPLQGTITFDLIVALGVTNTTPVAGTSGTASTITTVTATGGTGVTTYALDATSAALSWLSINSSGVVAISTSALAGTRSVTVTATGGSAPTGAAAAGTGSVTFTLVVN